MSLKKTAAIVTLLFVSFFQVNPVFATALTPTFSLANGNPEQSTTATISFRTQTIIPDSGVWDGLSGIKITLPDSSISAGAADYNMTISIDGSSKNIIDSSTYNENSSADAWSLEAGTPLILHPHTPIAANSLITITLPVTNPSSLALQPNALVDLWNQNATIEEFKLYGNDSFSDTGTAKLSYANMPFSSTPFVQYENADHPDVIGSLTLASASNTTTIVNLPALAEASEENYYILYRPGTVNISAFENDIYGSSVLYPSDLPLVNNDGNGNYTWATDPTATLSNLEAGTAYSALIILAANGVLYADTVLHFSTVGGIQGGSDPAPTPEFSTYVYGATIAIAGWMLYRKQKSFNA